ncbi:hypothetical protein BCB4_0043 [Bacillus phage B4]|uniref:Uncharacterized protein n=2 Tax=Bequatrovirus B4 TaxID=1918005 RepID=J9PRR7_9CAUD|nr:hypothetical protein BCB4_0043 [Bacillus phage B4]YP_009783637.1 hypothetical protein QLX26_gp041 [Bacillus phage B5S]MEB9013898.1 hypothetical protein [Bacillus cereus]AEW47275.1 hypothetical protein B5S_0041 [Bacillus phage B5S]AEZ65836.1 hypothetical protein BCB4_0043 [Bacillus phage B4]MEB9190488.1 hypothetical protein [Bacillus cereus]
MIELDDLVSFTVNEDGFTFWYAGIVILADVPFERLKEDKELSYQVLEAIHAIMLREKGYE